MTDGKADTEQPRLREFSADEYAPMAAALEALIAQAGTQAEREGLQLAVSIYQTLEDMRRTNATAPIAKVQ